MCSVVEKGSEELFISGRAGQADLFFPKKPRSS